jgi:hypothetical protein
MAPGGGRASVAVVLTAVSLKGIELYRDRGDAGRQLAARLEPLSVERPFVVGLPRAAAKLGGQPHAGSPAICSLLGQDRRLAVPVRDSDLARALADLIRAQLRLRGPQGLVPYQGRAGTGS